MSIFCIKRVPNDVKEVFSSWERSTRVALNLGWRTAWITVGPLDRRSWLLDEPNNGSLVGSAWVTIIAVASINNYGRKLFHLVSFFLKFKDYIKTYFSFLISNITLDITNKIKIEFEINRQIKLKF